MGKGSGRRNEDAQKVRDNWDLIFGIKKKPETLAEHVWNDKMIEMQSDIEKQLIEGNINDDKK
jgi:predicted RNA-binding protein